MKKIIASIIVLSIAITLGYLYNPDGQQPIDDGVRQVRTVDDVIGLYSEDAALRLIPYFEEAGIAYPPKELSLLAFKDSRKLEVWVPIQDSSILVKTYDVLAASGRLGPKLREGDRQVPEGIYKIDGLNPNSSYHLSLKLNYPNAFDLAWAEKENRTSPGGDIFIHGKAVSAGCLAMGDDGIEELFTLIHKVGRRNVEVVISPTDPALSELSRPLGAELWVNDLYQQIEQRIEEIRQ